MVYNCLTRLRAATTSEVPCTEMLALWLEDGVSRQPGYPFFTNLSFLFFEMGIDRNSANLHASFSREITENLSLIPEQHRRTFVVFLLRSCMVKPATRGMKYTINEVATKQVANSLNDLQSFAKLQDVLTLFTDFLLIPADSSTPPSVVPGVQGPSWQLWRPLVEKIRKLAGEGSNTVQETAVMVSMKQTIVDILAKIPANYALGPLLVASCDLFDDVRHRANITASRTQVEIDPSDSFAVSFISQILVHQPIQVNYSSENDKDTYVTINLLNPKPRVPSRVAVKLMSFLSRSPLCVRTEHLSSQLTIESLKSSDLAECIAGCQMSISIAKMSRPKLSDNSGADAIFGSQGLAALASKISTEVLNDFESIEETLKEESASKLQAQRLQAISALVRTCASLLALEIPVGDAKDDEADTPILSGDSTKNVASASPSFHYIHDLVSRGQRVSGQLFACVSRLSQGVSSSKVSLVEVQETLSAFFTLLDISASRLGTSMSRLHHLVDRFCVANRGVANVRLEALRWACKLLSPQDPRFILSCARLSADSDGQVRAQSRLHLKQVISGSSTCAPNIILDLLKLSLEVSLSLEEKIETASAIKVMLSNCSLITGKHSNFDENSDLVMDHALSNDNEARISIANLSTQLIDGFTHDNPTSNSNIALFHENETNRRLLADMYRLICELLSRVASPYPTELISTFISRCDERLLPLCVFVSPSSQGVSKKYSETRRDAASTYGHASKLALLVESPTIPKYSMQKLLQMALDTKSASSSPSNRSGALLLLGSILSQLPASPDHATAINLLSKELRTTESHWETQVAAADALAAYLLSANYHASEESSLVSIMQDGISLLGAPVTCRDWMSKASIKALGNKVEGAEPNASVVGDDRLASRPHAILMQRLRAGATLISALCRRNLREGNVERFNSLLGELIVRFSVKEEEMKVILAEGVANAIRGDEVGEEIFVKRILDEFAQQKLYAAIEKPDESDTLTVKVGVRTLTLSVKALDSQEIAKTAVVAVCSMMNRSSVNSTATPVVGEVNANNSNLKAIVLNASPLMSFVLSFISDPSTLVGECAWRTMIRIFKAAFTLEGGGVVENGINPLTGKVSSVRNLLSILVQCTNNIASVEARAASKKQLTTNDEVAALGVDTEIAEKRRHALLAIVRACAETGTRWLAWALLDIPSLAAWSVDVPCALDLVRCDLMGDGLRTSASSRRLLKEIKYAVKRSDNATNLDTQSDADALNLPESLEFADGVHPAGRAVAPLSSIGRIALLSFHGETSVKAAADQILMLRFGVESSVAACELSTSCIAVAIRAVQHVNPDLRAAGCRALCIYLKTISWSVIKEDFSTLWTCAFKCIDDVSEVVAKEAAVLGRTLRSTSLRFSDPEQALNFREATDAACAAIDSSIRAATMATGETAKQIRTLALDTIEETVKISGKLLTSKLGLLVPTLLEALSGLEPEAFGQAQYRLLNELGDNANSAIDAARIASSRSSVSARILSKLAQLVPAMANSQPQQFAVLANSIGRSARNGIGVATRAGACSFISDLARLEIFSVSSCNSSPHINSACISFLESLIASLSDSSPAVARTAATSIGALGPFLPSSVINAAVEQKLLSQTGNRIEGSTAGDERVRLASLASAGEATYALVSKVKLDGATRYKVAARAFCLMHAKEEAIQKTWTNVAIELNVVADGLSVAAASRLLPYVASQIEYLMRSSSRLDKLLAAAAISLLSRVLVGSSWDLASTSSGERGLRIPLRAEELIKIWIVLEKVIRSVPPFMGASALIVAYFDLMRTLTRFATYVASQKEHDQSSFGGFDSDDVAAVSSSKDNGIAGDAPMAVRVRNLQAQSRRALIQWMQELDERESSVSAQQAADEVDASMTVEDVSLAQSSAPTEEDVEMVDDSQKVQSASSLPLEFQGLHRVIPFTVRLPVRDLPVVLEGVRNSLRRWSSQALQDPCSVRMCELTRCMIKDLMSRLKSISSSEVTPTPATAEKKIEDGEETRAESHALQASLCGVSAIASTLVCRLPLDSSNLRTMVELTSLCLSRISAPPLRAASLKSLQEAFDVLVDNYSGYQEVNKLPSPFQSSSPEEKPSCANLWQSAQQWRRLIRQLLLYVAAEGKLQRIRVAAAKALESIICLLVASLKSNANADAGVWQVFGANELKDVSHVLDLSIFTLEEESNKETEEFQGEGQEISRRLVAQVRNLTKNFNVNGSSGEKGLIVVIQIIVAMCQGTAIEGSAEGDLWECARRILKKLENLGSRGEISRNFANDASAHLNFL